MTQCTECNEYRDEINLLDSQLSDAEEHHRNCTWNEQWEARREVVRIKHKLTYARLDLEEHVKAVHQLRLPV